MIIRLIFGAITLGKSLITRCRNTRPARRNNDYPLVSQQDNENFSASQQADEKNASLPSTAPVSVAPLQKTTLTTNTDVKIAALTRQMEEQKKAVKIVLQKAEEKTKAIHVFLSSGGQLLFGAILIQGFRIGSTYAIIEGSLGLALSILLEYTWDYPLRDHNFSFENEVDQKTAAIVTPMVEAFEHKAFPTANELARAMNRHHQITQEEIQRLKQRSFFLQNVATFFQRPHPTVLNTSLLLPSLIQLILDYADEVEENTTPKLN